MADETFVTELVIDLDLKKAQAQIAALSKQLHGAVSGASLGPLAGISGGRRIVGTTAIARRKSNADLALAKQTETAANRMARAAAALSFINKPGALRGLGRNIRSGFDSASSNTRGASLLGAAAGIGSLYAYGRFQTQSIGLAAPIVGASKGKIGFQQALGLSRDKYIPALDKFAAKTPFTLGGDIIPAATTGMNFGLQQENTPESVAEMVRMLGNMQVATGNRRTMSDLGVILGKGVARGEFQGEEIQQLAEGGINVDEIVREIGGKTLRKRQKEGLQGVYGTDAKLIMQAVRAIYLDTTKKGGLVKELSTTLPGAVSTFTDAVDRFGRRVGKSGEERFGISGIILDGADALNSASQDVIDAFGPLSAVVAGVSGVLKGFGASIQGILLAGAGIYATHKFAQSIGRSAFHGGTTDILRRRAFNQRGTLAQKIGSGLLTSSRHLIWGGAGAIAGSYLGSQFAPEGYEQEGALFGSIAGGAAGSGLLNILGSPDTSKNGGFTNKNLFRVMAQGLAAVNPKLYLLAGGLAAANGVLALLEESSEKQFQQGLGLSDTDKFLLTVHKALVAEDGNFNYRGDARGDKLKVEIYDRRVVLEREKFDTNELVTQSIGDPYGGVSP